MKAAGGQMKIAYAFNYYQLPGGENMWFNSEPDLFREHGHEVVIYSRDNKEMDSWPALKKGALFWQTSYSRQTYDEFLALLRREKPDIVHVYNTLVLISPSIFHACRAAGVPVVQTLYNYRLVCPAATLLRDGQICEECMDHSLLRNVIHRCYRDSAVQSAALSLALALNRRWGTWRECVDAFIVPSEFMKSKLAHGGADPGQFIVKPNWHAPDPGVREATGSDALYIGRLSPEKGVDILLAAWKSSPDLPRLKIIGDGPLLDDLQRAIAAGTASPVEYLGRKPHAEVVSTLKEAYCLIIPSQWYEAFPHTILEAAACGVPILATRLGTLADIIQDGKTGLLFTPGDPGDLAAKVRELFADPAAAERMGMAARKLYETEYTAARAYEFLMKIYGDIIENRRAGGLRG